MPTITISQDLAGTCDSGFAAKLTVGSGDPFQVSILPAFSEKQEQALKWYLERWPRFPFIDTVAAERAAHSIKEYGTSLFGQIFACEEAHDKYAQLLGHLSELTIEVIAKSAGFQALHWEALWDPSRPRPLAVDCAVVRSCEERVCPLVPLQPSPVLNVLVVVARPGGVRDEGYRTISRPLVEAIQAAKLGANVELLRPGTYKALSERLDARGPGFYHIIHFDCHGGLMAYSDVYRAGYLLTDRHGREDLLHRRYQGRKAFLELECGKEVDLVEASEVAQLLADKGIPICMLNACQSGMQVQPDCTEGTRPNCKFSAHDTSLGSHLMLAGVQVVLAMGYSITVSAARTLMEAVYRHLFDQNPVLKALQLGRRELYCHKGRTARHKVLVDLEDWLLPVVYVNQQVDLQLRDTSKPQEKSDVRSLPDGFRFRCPTYGFIGRDLDILKIECALLEKNVLLLQGMGGTGKSTLLKYLQEWWQVTNFAHKVFYIGYDERPWTLQHVLFEMSHQLFDERGQRTFQSMNPEEQAEEMVSVLRGGPYVLMLDNLESVTGQELAIQHALAPEQCGEIHKFLCRLMGGDSKVLLGSRSEEQWLKDTFGDNVHHLEGLDPESRSELAQNILERVVCDEQQIAALYNNSSYRRLMAVLAGYPLAMEVVLANLEHQSPEQILAGMAAADVELDAPSQDKTRSILRCVEYSYGVMCPSSQQLLLCLAPFKGVLVWRSLRCYVDKLGKSSPWRWVEFAAVEGAVKDAIRWGLLSPCSLQGGHGDASFLSVQPVFPYFLQLRLAEMDDGHRTALHECFKNAYKDMAKVYRKQIDSQDAAERKVGMQLCELEYENLYSALEMCIKDQDSLGAISGCLNQYLQMKKDFRRGLKFAELVAGAYKKYPVEGRTGLEHAEAQLLLGNWCMDAKVYKRAKDSYEESLLICESINIGNVTKRAIIAPIYHQLGVVAQELRDVEEARGKYQRALDIYIEFNDRYSQASTYHQLGVVAQKLRDFEEARRNYQRGLDIYIEFNNRYSQASTYHNLGVVAQELRDFEEARRNYQQALDIYIEFNDRYSQASTYHQLGTVTQKLRDFEEARWNYQRALDIKIEFKDRHSQARTYHNLGAVAGELRDFEEARRNYQRALDIKIEFNDRYSQAVTYHQLGRVAEELREFEEARRNYQRALDIYIEFSDRYDQADTYHQLGVVAQELRDFEEARRNYQRALDIKIEFNDRYEQASTYHQLGRVAEELRDFEEARWNYQRALDIFIEFDDSYRQLIVSQSLERLGAAVVEN